MDALHLELGDYSLEIGAGPGYVSLVLADRIGLNFVSRSPTDCVNFGTSRTSKETHQKLTTK
jgi:hypothetical protein